MATVIVKDSMNPPMFSHGSRVREGTTAWVGRYLQVELRPKSFLGASGAPCWSITPPDELAVSACTKGEGPWHARLSRR